MTPDPDQPYVGRNAFAHKGGMHVAGVQADARTFEHIGPGAGRQQPRRPDLRALGQGHGARAAPRAPGIELDADAAKRAVERLKEREHRGYHYEAADASFELLLRREAGELRAAVPARELPGDHREARRRQGRDRGDDQDLGRRRALRAHRRGQRPGQRARPGAARRDHRAATRTWPTSSWPTTRSASSTSTTAPARSPACCSTPPTGSESGARSASRRTSSRPPGRRWSTRSSTRSSRGGRPTAPSRRPSSAAAAGADAVVSDGEPIPLARPDARRRARRSWCSRCCAPAGSRSGRCWSASSAPSPPGSASTTRSRSPRHRRAAPRRAGAGLGRGRRGGHHARSASSPRPTACSTRAPRRSSATSTRSRSTSTRRGRAPRSASAPPGCCRSTSSATRPAMPELERLAAERGLGILEDACEALGAVDADGRPVGARGNLAIFAFYANKQLTTGEGGDDRPRRRREVAARAAQRAQPGPRAGHGLARPRPARLQLPALRPRRPRSASPSSSGSTRCSPTRARVAALYASAWRDRRRPLARATRRPRAAVRGRGRRAAQLVRLRRPAARRRRPRRGDRRRSRERGVASKAYLPCIHLMPHYRERFGYREGEFPVAEDVAARSLALPFFPEMTRRRSSASARRWPRPLLGDWT